ncbi:50S ribosomal protein L11 methyltransferase [Oligoflexaceae bacterium]|nr:50S ribosomal protein L11 methyltransferase [Oligoflexaceae bacterium]
MAEIPDIFELKVYFLSSEDAPSHKRILVSWLSEQEVPFAEDYVDGLDSDSSDLDYDDFKTAVPTAIYFESQEELESTLTSLRKLMPSDSISFETSKIEGIAYSQSWRPTDFWIETQKFCVGNTPPADTQDKYWIEMNNGAAFGNGQHATTEACLRLIENFDYQSDFKTVLDVGTGTGILAIAAGRLGAKRIFVTEISENLLGEALENSKKHEVEIEAHMVASLDTFSDNSLDLVFANILVPVLHELSKDFARVLKDNGRLVLSGFIEKESFKICDVMKKLGLNEVERFETRGWLAISFDR